MNERVIDNVRQMVQTQVNVSFKIYHSKSFSSMAKRVTLFTGRWESRNACYTIHKHEREYASYYLLLACNTCSIILTWIWNPLTESTFSIITPNLIALTQETTIWLWTSFVQSVLLTRILVTSQHICLVWFQEFVGPSYVFWYSI